MRKILTVDDSRAIRSMISKQVKELGFEIDEAEDGTQGLSRLEECEYDLVLLDVTMPVMDGPTMLAKMREGGNKTPVLMLTSESKRSIVSAVMKQGIEDYILKPFKPEELKAKIMKRLGMDAVAESSVAAVLSAVPVAQPSPPPEAAVGAGRQFIDILIIDDMENVQRKLRSLLPAHLSLNAAASAQSALTAARERIFRVVLIDSDIPDVNTAVLLTQVRALQPHAACLELCLRTANAAEADASSLGFDGVMFKPFDPGSIEDFLQQYFDNQDLLVTQDNLLRVAPFIGKEDRLERYFQRVSKLTDKSLEQVAAACFDDVIFDISNLPRRADRVPKLMVGIAERALKMGLTLRLVGPAEVKQLLCTFTETSSLACFNTVDEARAA